ncbi:MAG TPA: hypothetical protein VHZ31_04660 [Solirubrobacteraceae bacterium]|jgi:hypothetical protein|nr:hypothetical protein [Solirubrobacteraceae bacterium]
MLTISILFALLVAVWGFSGAVATVAKRRLAQARPAPRPARSPSTRPGPQRARGTRPVASA